jgi:anti-sigma B factor antagonist
MPELTPLSLERVGNDSATLSVRATGCLSEASSGGASQTLESLLGGDCYAKPVLLDLNYVDFIDSSGIGWLLGAHRRFRTAGGALVLHSIPPVVRHTLKVLRMDEVFRLAKDESEARSLVGGEAAL